MVIKAQRPIKEEKAGECKGKSLSNKGSSREGKKEKTTLDASDGALFAGTEGRLTCQMWRCLLPYSLNESSAQHRDNLPLSCQLAAAVSEWVSCEWRTAVAMAAATYKMLHTMGQKRRAKSSAEREGRSIGVTRHCRQECDCGEGGHRRAIICSNASCHSDVVFVGLPSFPPYLVALQLQ